MKLIVSYEYKTNENISYGEFPIESDLELIKTTLRDSTKFHQNNTIAIHITSITEIK